MLRVVVRQYRQGVRYTEDRAIVRYQTLTVHGCEHKHDNGSAFVPCIGTNSNQ